MISDAERREVAKRLRSKKPAEFGEPLVRSVFRHVFRSLYPKQIYPVSNWVLRMPYVLADLIDRPTCFDTESKDSKSFTCSACGFSESKLVVCSFTLSFSSVKPSYRYCPKCGAAVVEDAR